MREGIKRKLYQKGVNTPCNASILVKKYIFSGEGEEKQLDFSAQYIPLYCGEVVH